MKLKAAAIFLLIAIDITMALGVGPSSINFDKVLRGGYSEQTLFITNTGNEPAEMKIEKEGDVADWLRFFSREDPALNPNSFIAAPRTTIKMQAVVTPPLDAEVKSYDAAIIVTSAALGNETERGNVLGINTAVRATVHIELTGEQIVDYAVESLSIRDAEEGLPIQLSILGQNKGNVRIRPSVHIDIFDRDRKNVVRSVDLSGSEVLPTTKGFDILNISSVDLEIGQYWAVVNVSAGGRHVYGELLTFDVIERGSLRVKGELLRIDNAIWVEVDDIVKINAVFKNTGELSTNSKFKGEVYLNDRIVGLLESEELIVPAGEEMQLPTFFTPNKDGRYVIKGVVYYSKKVTFEKEGVINVLPARFSMVDLIAGGAVYAVIIAAMIFVYINYKRRGSYERYGRVSERQKKIDERLERLTKQSEEMGKKLKGRKHKK